MQQQLINLNPDLKKLWDEGYQLEVCGDKYLLVHHIPYLNSSRQVKYGTLVCLIGLASPTRVSPPADHTIFFKGEAPYNTNGTAMHAVINNSNRHQLAEDIV